MERRITEKQGRRDNGRIEEINFCESMGKLQNLNLVGLT